MSENSRPVVLVFIDWYLPGYRAGGPIRSMANMVQHLQGEFDFRIVTRNTDYTQSKPYPDVSANQWTDGPFGERVMYLSETSLGRRKLAEIIAETNPDVVYINGMYSRYFSILPLRLLKGKGKKVIVASRGMLAEGALGVKSQKKKWFLRWASLRGYYNSITFHATNPGEREDIQRVLGTVRNIEVADNFPALRVIPLARKSGKEQGVLRLINVARIAPEKNLLFAIECLQNVREGKVRFEIYGPVYNEEYYLRCKSAAEGCGPNVEVLFHGPLQPEKIPDVLMRQDLMFMPTLGENYGHIIIESLMSGTPTLISDRTPFTGTKGVVALPLAKREEFVKELNRWVSMNDQEHQHYIADALEGARKNNDTSPLLERYRRMFGK
jgi:glycosyltransferase involved in cell wall biosynthesis